MLINGQWHHHKEVPVPEQSQFRNWITPEGQAGPTGQAGFKAQSKRYHLYVSYACPWAHRTLIFRVLKELTEHISVSVVHPHLLERGWEFIPSHPLFNDPINYCRCLYEIYLLADPFYTGRVSVPVLWDKHQHTIVSNESADIIRMLNSAFNHLTHNALDFYPPAWQAEIDPINQFVYENINQGVYRCGFATSQAVYDQAFEVLFNSLNALEKRLTNQTYLINDTLTEADWRLFTTLIRFDVVYYSHFKCNYKRLSDYPHLSRYLKHLYHLPGISETVNFYQIKQLYYFSHVKINPTRIVPKGPLLDL